MHDHGIKVVPYINGRLLDTLTIDWITGVGKEAAVKINWKINFLDENNRRLSDNPPILNVTKENIEMNVTAIEPAFVREVYAHGNINVVMCPATSYW